MKADYSISIIGKLEGSISHEKIIEEFRNAKREPLAYEFVKPDPLRYLFPCPKYQPAKPYPWTRIGCNGHNTIEAVNFNSEQHITPWQPPFSWYPRGSRISNAWRPQACKFCFELICGWRLDAQKHSEKWDQLFAKGPCLHCNGLDLREKRFSKWLAKNQKWTLRANYSDEVPEWCYRENEILIYIPLSDKRPISHLYKLASADALSNPYKAIDNIPKYGSPKVPICSRIYLYRIEHLKESYGLKCYHKACRCVTVDQRALFDLINHRYNAPKLVSEDEEETSSSIDDEGIQRDSERDPGDYAMADDFAEREYESDTREPNDYKLYVNEMPYRKGTKPAGSSGRSARDGFGSNYPILGTCSECGGGLAKGLPVWNSHANKYIMQDFVDIHRDDVVCLQCGLIHELPDRGPDTAINECLLDGTLANDTSIYVPFDLELYEKSKADRVRLLKEYYVDNPNSKKLPKDKDLALPKQEYHKKHDSLTLEDPKNGLRPEQIKRRQIVRIFAEMWSREGLPDDPIKTVLNSSIEKRRFSRVFKDLYGEELSNKAVEDRMIMAQRYLREKAIDDVNKRFEWMRKHNRSHGVNINLNNFIKP